MPVRANESRRGIALLITMLLLASAIGCRDREAAPSTEPRPLQTLLIGLIPEHNIFRQRQRYEPLADYLSDKVGARIDLKVLSRYGNVIENFVSNDLDGAFFGSFTAALAFRKLGVEPLARPEYLDGSSTYHGLLFVRKDSGIRTAADMKGKRFAFVDKATTAGWLLPMHYFQTHGIADYRTWFKETYFTGTHEGAIRDVLDKKADVGAAKNTVFDRLAAADPEMRQELIVLTRSPDVPANALCVRRDLDDSLKKRLLENLLTMDRDEEGRKILDHFGARRFIVTTEADYAPVFEYAATVGLDLETYDYIDD
jgi:phosphonate transport system substrate-binding protein